MLYSHCTSSTFQILSCSHLQLFLLLLPPPPHQDYKAWLSRLEAGVRLPRTEVCPEYLYSRVRTRAFPEVWWTLKLLFQNSITYFLVNQSLI